MIASFASKIFMLRDSITKSVLFGVGANLASLYQADFNERKEVGIFDLAKKVGSGMRLVNRTHTFSLFYECLVLAVYRIP